MFSLLHQERHDNLRQLFRLLVWDMMPRAFDRHDLRIREELCTVAAHRLHEIAFSPVDEQDRTFQATDKSLDLTLRHRRRGAIATSPGRLPTVSPALVA